ncbi:hypothetical protein D1872_292890 [compost metagenome]
MGKRTSAQPYFGQNAPIHDLIFEPVAAEQPVHQFTVLVLQDILPPCLVQLRRKLRCHHFYFRRHVFIPFKN